MNTYRLIKIIPAPNLATAIKTESKYPVEEAFQDKTPTEGNLRAIGFDIEKI